MIDTKNKYFASLWTDVPLLIIVGVLYGVGKETECNGNSSDLLLAYIVIKSWIP